MDKYYGRRKWGVNLVLYLSSKLETVVALEVGKSFCNVIDYSTIQVIESSRILRLNKQVLMKFPTQNVLELNTI